MWRVHRVVLLVYGRGLALEIEMLSLHYFVTVMVCEGRTLTTKTLNVANE